MEILKNSGARSAQGAASPPAGSSRSGGLGDVGGHSLGVANVGNWGGVGVIGSRERWRSKDGQDGRRTIKETAAQFKSMIVPRIFSDFSVCAV